MRPGPPPAWLGGPDPDPDPERVTEGTGRHDPAGPSAQAPIQPVARSVDRCGTCGGDRARRRRHADGTPPAAHRRRRVPGAVAGTGDRGDPDRAPGRPGHAGVGHVVAVAGQLHGDAEPEKGFYYRSDHFNFAKAGVPALDTDDGLDYVGKPAGFGKQKKDEYTKDDYHSPSDEVKADWDLTGLAEQAKLLFAVGYRVAQTDKFPEWKPGNEFRAVREKTIKK